MADARRSLGFCSHCCCRNPREEAPWLEKGEPGRQQEIGSQSSSGWKMKSAHVTPQDKVQGISAKLHDLKLAKSCHVSTRYWYGDVISASNTKSAEKGTRSLFFPQTGFKSRCLNHFLTSVCTSEDYSYPERRGTLTIRRTGELQDDSRSHPLGQRPASPTDQLSLQALLCRKNFRQIT